MKSNLERGFRRCVVFDRPYCVGMTGLTVWARIIQVSISGW